MKKLFLSSLFLILTSCTAAPTATPVASTEQNKVETEVAESEAKPSQTIKDKAKSCICIKLWMPVCGENKKTYGNSCEAKCAGVKYTQGECAKTI